MKSVFVYSVSAVLSQGLRVVLSNDFHVGGMFSSFEALEEQLSTTCPDLLVVEMTSAVSPETLTRLRNVARNTLMILWIDSITPELVSAYLSQGIRGVLSKSASAEAHIHCLAEVAAGGVWIDQALTHSLLNTRAVRLTPRERQMVGLLVQGLTNKEVAWAMGVSEGTVKVYMSRLFPKIGVCDRFELALVALKNLSGRSELDKARQREPGQPATPIPFPDQIRIDSATLQSRCIPFPKPIPQVAAAGMAGQVPSVHVMRH